MVWQAARMNVINALAVHLNDLKLPLGALNAITDYRQIT